MPLEERTVHLASPEVGVSREALSVRLTLVYVNAANKYIQKVYAHKCLMVLSPILTG